MAKGFLDNLAEGLNLGRDALVKYGKLGVATLAAERLKDRIRDVEARLGRLSRERLSTAGELPAEDPDAKGLLDEIASESEKLRQTMAEIRELKK